MRVYLHHDIHNYYNREVITMGKTYTTPEAAKRLGVHPGTLRRWRQDRDPMHEHLTVVGAGRAVHYTAESVDRLARERVNA